MTRVLCPQETCVFWDGGVCGADEITLDPEELTCISVEEIDDLLLDEGEMSGWDEEPEDDDWDDEELLGEDDDDWQPY